MFLNNLVSISRRCSSHFSLRNIPFKVSKRPASNQTDANIDDVINIEKSIFENSSRNHSPVKSSKNLLRQLEPKENSPKLQAKSIQSKKNEAKLIEDAELGLQFFRGADEFKQFLTAVRSQKRREGRKKVIIEGRRLIMEAIENNLCMDTLIFSQKDQLAAIKDAVAYAQKSFNSKIFKVSQHELKMWSTLTTPPGLLAVFERPTATQVTKMNQTLKKLPITVVCDNIREPNNLGSIIRTCAAVPCSQIIIIKGCCDPWESKALRGGCGGHFRLVIRDDIYWDELHTYIPEDCRNDYRVFVAENNLDRANGKASFYRDLEPLGVHNVVIIGGETYGVSDEAYKFLENSGKGKCLFIPLADGIDSLNVVSALTLILFEFKAQITQTVSPNIIT